MHGLDRPVVGWRSWKPEPREQVVVKLIQVSACSRAEAVECSFFRVVAKDVSKISAEKLPAGYHFRKIDSW